MSATISILGMDLPILADLSAAEPDWYLVAHPNGPAICCPIGFGILSVLETESNEVPIAVRRLAVQLYRERSWPLVRDVLSLLERLNEVTR